MEVSTPAVRPLRAPNIDVAVRRSSWGIDTRDLEPNSNDDLTWRWLKKEIAKYQASPGYEEHSLTLGLEDGHNYVISMNELNNDEFKSENELSISQGLPQLNSNHRYARVGVMIDGWVCPNWSGLIDISEQRLLYFSGSGA